MRSAVERLTEPLFGWIPDITLVPRPRQVAMGVVVSIILHALIFCAAMVAMLVFPERFERPPEAAQPNLEVIVQPKPQPEPVAVMPKKPERRFITNEGLKPGEKPKDAQFEADKDMTAGSEVPPTGTSDLPGQEGEKAPHMRDFVDQDISLNKTQMALRQEKMKPLQPAPSEEQPATVAPLYAPQPLDDKARAAAEKAKPQEKLPEPAKPTRATPSPLEKVKVASETQIAMLEAKPTPPPPRAGEQPQTQPQTVKSYALPTPVPLSASSPSKAYEQQLRKTHNESIISNRGISGVNAINTPAGRWTMMVNRAFSQNWQLFIHQNPDMVSVGSVRVKFAVSREGGRPKVLAVEPLDKVSSTTIQACTRAVAETPLAPPPADLFDDESAQKLEDDITFTLY